MDNHETTSGCTFYCVLLILQQHVPHSFSPESVVQPYSSGEISAIIEQFDAAGYIVHYRAFSSDEFGLPPVRRRLYIWGFRKSELEAAGFPADSFHDLCEGIMSGLVAGHTLMGADEFVL